MSCVNNYQDLCKNEVLFLVQLLGLGEAVTRENIYHKDTIQKIMKVIQNQRSDAESNSYDIDFNPNAPMQGKVKFLDRLNTKFEKRLEKIKLAEARQLGIPSLDNSTSPGTPSLDNSTSPGTPHSAYDHHHKSDDDTIPTKDLIKVLNFTDEDAGQNPKIIPQYKLVNKDRQNGKGNLFNIPGMADLLNLENVKVTNQEGKEYTYSGGLKQTRSGFVPHLFGKLTSNEEVIYEGPFSVGKVDLKAVALLQAIREERKHKVNPEDSLRMHTIKEKVSSNDKLKTSTPKKKAEVTPRKKMRVNPSKQSHRSPLTDMTNKPNRFLRNQ